MYCVKCGVELADSEKKCPLCQTPVYFPGADADAKPPYPRYKKEHEQVSVSGALFVVSMLFLLPILLSIVCDLELNSRMGWSIYVVGGLMVTYVMVALPMWFRRPNPVIFIPCDFVAIGLYVWIISLMTGGHWYLGFAFPVIGMTAIITTAVVALCKYLSRGHLFVFGGASVVTGCLMMLVEFLAHITFGTSGMFVWSFYPMTVLSLIGAFLILVGICKPLRESLERKFFI